MKRRIENARFAVGDWIAAHDTRSLEFLLALASMSTGWLAVAKSPTGAPSAPILNAAMSFMTRQPAEWASAAGALGILILLALGVGTRAPESTWPRAWVMGLTTAFYIAVAIGNAQQPGGVPLGVRYAIPALGALWATIVLVIEAQVQEQTKQIAAHSQMAIDRAVVAFNQTEKTYA